MQRAITLLFSVCISSVVAAATFTSIASGNFTASSTWSHVGSDADNIPDQDDDVTIIGGHTVTLIASSACKNLTINATGSIAMNNFTMLNWGSLTNNGTISGIGAWQFRATGTYTGNPLNYQGNVYFYSSYTIAAGVNITKNNGGIIIGSSCNVTNNGTVILNQATSGYVQFSSATSQWVNAANSSLTISANFVGTGILTATSSGNTVTYRSNTTTAVKAGSYRHLILTGPTTHTKALLGNIVVSGNLTIQSPVTLSWAGFDISLGGNWLNSANTTCTNMGNLNFTGAGTQTITRTTGNTEIFNTINLNGFGTVSLADTLRTNGSININSGTLDVTASNFNIHCRGNFVNGGTFNARNGTVFMDGTSAQSIDGSSAITFYNLTTSNSAGVSVSFSHRISNILRVSAGSFGPSIFGAFTLLATGPTTCARIAPLGATGSLTGSAWVIQTYINGPATAYWQYMSTPVSGNTINDWDADPRFYMSGVGGNDGTACCPTFFSVRTYNTAPNTYSNVTSTGTAIVPGRGYMVWMADNLNSLTAPLVYDSRGTPNSGTVNRAVVAGGAGAGYNLVGNPYACPITYASVVASSSATLNANFLVLQENGSYATSPNGGTIAASQGFMCIATTSANITFTESCKSTSANPNVIREAAGNQVRIKAGNDVNGLGEETTIKLDPAASESYDGLNDLPYLASPYENATHIWTQNGNGDQFILNNLGTADDHLLIPVNVVTTTPGGQILTVKDLNTVTEYNCAWLEDLTTGQRVNLNETDTYTFNEPEMGATRNFILHLERTNDCAFDLQNSVASLDSKSNVFVNNGQVYAGFEFETENVVTISMFDLNGKMVMDETTMNVGTQTVALTNPDAHGIYLVRIASGDEVVTRKIYY